MKVLSIALLMLLGLAACNQKSEPKTEAQPEASSEKMVEIKLAEFAEPKKDLICGMPLKEGEIADTASYNGQLYGFCSKECKAEFIKDPQAHLNQK